MASICTTVRWGCAAGGTPGWRWLDLRGLATDLVSRRTSWAGTQIERVIYCTARIDGAANNILI